MPEGARLVSEDLGAQNLSAVLTTMKKAHAHSRPVSAALRIDRLRRLQTLIRRYQRRFVEAASEDFGTRHPVQTRMELAATLEAARHAEKHVRGWMKPRRVPLPLPLRLTGARTEIYPQPLGVVGVVSPWNFPYNLVLAPLADILAAGNVAMVKPSESTPACNEALAAALVEWFDPLEARIFPGGIEVARAFAALPFDHLLFTGSPAIAKRVMHAAADELVPVTLELGGKCPVIVDADADLEAAARRVALGNIQNAGQICLAPDILFVPHAAVDPFIACLRRVICSWLPSITDNPDYTCMIHRRAFDRVNGYLQEARAAGARIELLAPQESRTVADRYKIAPAVIIDPEGRLSISAQEIFGPLMVLRPYADLAEVIDYLDRNGRPLAIYYFGKDLRRARLLRERTVSGGMTVNDVISHATVGDAPLGGVGNSGMGAYHGRAGFDSFSHLKTVYYQGAFSIFEVFAPPYKARHTKLLDWVLGRSDR